MSRRTPHLLARLRRHRGVWVLALAVLLFKVAMSTFCVLDGPRVAFGGDVADTHALALEDDDTCVLGEGGGCHCTCAHAVALPSHDASVPVMATLSHLAAPLPPLLSPSIERSPLRPPIA
ncbi:hypothetical protein [Luteibacter yeojuensis]|uniref:Uncharacterized protein n=1 Tax=Luteibacter yeojuensis TaxID=345309 RepID=A0A7X5TPJ1_9GAMM|nr:hypothetical protein [Luteibacter yeojuensis]NID14522.1 hypothetical protein [Luteibacter yeojuensis]